MDAKNNSETRQRRREEALVRRLGEAFDRLGPHGTGDCPDSEQFALYHEQALAPGEAARCEAHFAACPRCRKILAVLAASAEAPLGDQEVARLGELASAAQGQPHREPTVKPERFGGFHWRLRWLVPAFGAAAALVLWLAVRPPWRHAEQVSSPVLIAEGPKPLVPSERQNAAQTENATGQSNARAKTAVVTSKAKESETLKAPAPKGLDSIIAQNQAADERLAARGESIGSAGKPALARDVEAEKKTEQGELSGGVGGSAESGATPPTPPAAPAPAAPPPQAAALSAQAQLRTMQRAAPTSRAESNLAPKAAQAPVPQAVVTDKFDLAKAAPIISISRSGRNFSLMLESPSSGAIWKIESEARLERSNDGGKTWVFQSSAGAGEWLAGAAVSEKVWWLVGANGAIARTTDGEHWERITPPASAADASGKQPDWLDVVASDSQTATISAGNQQRYATRDGGKTWQKQ